MLLGLSNGEGLRQIERNLGKTSTAVIDGVEPSTTAKLRDSGAARAPSLWCSVGVVWR